MRVLGKEEIQLVVEKTRQEDIINVEGVLWRKERLDPPILGHEVGWVNITWGNEKELHFVISSDEAGKWKVFQVGEEGNIIEQFEPSEPVADIFINASRKVDPFALGHDPS